MTHINTDDAISENRIDQFARLLMVRTADWPSWSDEHPEVIFPCIKFEKILEFYQNWQK